MDRRLFSVGFAAMAAVCILQERGVHAAAPASSAADAGRKCSTVIDCANRALQAAEDAKQAADRALVPLKGAVIAFNRTACPVGWSEYVPARGRFIRGIDEGNPSTDPDGRRQPGNLQDQMIADHTHPIQGRYLEAQGGYGFRGWGFASNSVGPGNTYHTDAVTSGAGVETRPKNVALLYCELQ